MAAHFIHEVEIRSLKHTRSVLRSKKMCEKVLTFIIPAVIEQF